MQGAEFGLGGGWPRRRLARLLVLCFFHADFWQEVEQ